VSIDEEIVQYIQWVFFDNAMDRAIWRIDADIWGIGHYFAAPMDFGRWVFLVAILLGCYIEFVGWQY